MQVSKILLGLFLRSEKDKQAFFKKYESELRQKLDSQISEIDRKLNDETQKQLAIIDVKREELKELSRRVDEKKLELQQKNDLLLDQIKTLEAKASPSNVWANAFSEGFSKAWDMMVPIMADGVKRVEHSIRDSEREKAVKNINRIVEDRVAQGKPKDITERINKKIKSIEDIAKKSRDPRDIERARYYVESLKWVLNDND